MSQRIKLMEDIEAAIEWLNEDNFREFADRLVQDNPELIKRLKREWEKSERRQKRRAQQQEE